MSEKQHRNFQGNKGSDITSKFNINFLFNVVTILSIFMLPLICIRYVHFYFILRPSVLSRHATCHCGISNYSQSNDNSQPMFDKLIICSLDVVMLDHEIFILIGVISL